MILEILFTFSNPKTIVEHLKFHVCGIGMSSRNKGTVRTFWERFILRINVMIFINGKTNEFHVFVTLGSRPKATGNRGMYEAHVNPWRNYMVMIYMWFWSMLLITLSRDFVYNILSFDTADNITVLLNFGMISCLLQWSQLWCYRDYSSYHLCFLDSGNIPIHG